MAKKTNFQKESEATSTALTVAPSLMAQLFTKSDKPIDEAKLERRNLPPMLKPDDVPVWTPEEPIMLQAEIVRVVESPNTTIKGKLLWLKTASGHELTFPCTGVIRNALAPGIKADDEKLTAALEKEVGKTLFLKRTPNKASKYKKAMFMFDVYTAKA